MKILGSIAYLFLLSLAVDAQTAKSGKRTAHPVDLPLQRCPNILVYQRGTADSFALPTDPVHPSAPLATLLAGGNAVAYDDASCNVWWGDTIYLDSCVFCFEICSATLEITMRSCGDGLSCNDEITVGQAPFGKGNAGFVLWQGPVDPNGCPGGGGAEPIDTPKDTRTAKATTPGPVVVKRIPLDVTKLRDLVCKRKVTSLDVFVQDDQIIDSMRLIITKP